MTIKYSFLKPFRKKKKGLLKKILIILLFLAVIIAFLCRLCTSAQKKKDNRILDKETAEIYLLKGFEGHCLQ